MNYYNEWDKDAATWLREIIKAGLVPHGDVDERSITEVKAHELTDYNQCHFFAGIGGWPLAFQLAGVDPDENADSGSCPCQPFSGTGKQMGFADPRHLWPAFRRIETRRQPATIYGEQVASALGREWLARVFSDLEIMGYAGAGADLCSAGLGSPNIRQRLYWAGDALCERSFSAAQRGANCREEGRGTRNGLFAGSGATEQLANPAGERLGEARDSGSRETEWTGGGCAVGGVAQSDGRERDGEPDGQGRLCDGSPAGRQQSDSEPESYSESHGLGYADHARREGRLIRWHGEYERAAGETSVAGPATLGGFWGVADLIYCRDEKWRRIEPGSFPLADGIPSRVGPLLTELRKLGRSSIALARANRNIRLKGYGNAINPWVAARFIVAHRQSKSAGGDRGITVRPELEDIEA